MRVPDDRALESLLRRTLRDEAAALPLRLTWQGLEARWRERAERRGRSRRNLLVLGLAAALLLPLAALSALTERRPATDGTFQAIFVRQRNGVDVAAVRPDGQERLLRHGGGDTWRVRRAEVAPSGWLAVNRLTSYDDPISWLLLDLAHPDRPERAVDQPSSSRPQSAAWTPDGQFSMWTASGALTLVDPISGSREYRSLETWLGLVLGWAADGSGLVVGAHELASSEAWSEFSSIPIYDDQGGPYALQWQTVHLDHSPPTVGIPALHPRPLPAWYRSTGEHLQACDSTYPTQAMACANDPKGAVLVADALGGTSAWKMDELGRDRVVDANFSASGDGLWILARETTRPGLVLARVTRDGRVTRVTSIPVGLIPFGARWRDSDMSSIVAVAPDDSLVVVANTTPGFFIPDEPLVVVPTTGGLPTYHEGTFAGFVSSDTAGEWEAGTFAAVDRSVVPEPSGAPFPTLLPVEAAIANQFGGTAHRAVLVRTHEPTLAGAGRMQTYDLGLAPLEDGYGVILVCSGPSDATLTTDLPDAFFGPALTNRCLSRDATGGTTGGSIQRAVHIQLTADPATAWQVVIFDPADEP